MEVLSAPTRYAGPATIPSSLLRVGEAWAHLVGSRPDYRRNDLLYRANARFLCEVGLGARDVLPANAQRYDLAVAEFENICESETNHWLEELVNHGLNELAHLWIQYLRTCFASGTLGPGQAGTLISGFNALRASGAIWWC